MASNAAERHAATDELSRAVTLVDLVDALAAFELTSAEVQAVAGAPTDDRSGGHDSGSGRAARNRLLELSDVVLALTDSLTPRGVGEWLHAQNRLLGGRQPLEVAASGDITSVRRAAHAFIEGSYV